MKTHYTGNEDEGPTRLNSVKNKPQSMTQENYNDMLGKEQAAEDLFNLDRNLPNLSEVNETIVQEELDDEEAANDERQQVDLLDQGHNPLRDKN